MARPLHPLGWTPDTPIPTSCWSRLPEPDDGLEAAAARFYGVAPPHLLPTCGSQAAIQLLPHLRARSSRVAILSPTYAEHAHAWQKAGHTLTAITPHHLKNIAETDFDVVIAVNPNNPTGLRLPPQQLLTWHAHLARKGGWLIVDEAFMDATPQESLAPHGPLPGLILLRSLGKFFGLAGARVGFLLATPPLLNAAQETLGPWPLSGPSRWIAREALSDTPWQTTTRNTLKQASQRLAILLRTHRLPPAGGTALFQWVPTPESARWWHHLISQGILVRQLLTPPSLRFGLPGPETGWQKLATALKTIS